MIYDNMHTYTYMYKEYIMYGYSICLQYTNIT